MDTGEWRGGGREKGRGIEGGTVEGVEGGGEEREGRRGEREPPHASTVY